MTSDPTLKFLLFKDSQLQVMEPGDSKVKKTISGEPFSREVASIVGKIYSKFILGRKKTWKQEHYFEHIVPSASAK